MVAYNKKVLFPILLSYIKGHTLCDWLTMKNSVSDCFHSVTQKVYTYIYIHMEWIQAWNSETFKTQMSIL